ncbi:16S rRNA (uracil(1498)-N(3))-methyltransferase [Piscinibacter sp. HJYY11]|uniref:16S rRNA (uracil(1498)-N(3))-methyltransferase n=1 Tax=Piscinibacter sp. HJYY11 TaxID=2801333 RepID=UPI00191F4C0E|nr:16S rRNA (uracil(1498)-N(3))-methyltransferase [Piscinibacter sp. HJYY11]MBL0728790.1 16S rRNA (uracil(1498)-N(3))-methyltransferase [Piscinibacter sp. HJYY11]
MPARVFVDQALVPDALIDLPPGPARHVQVLRLQPGDPLTLFNGHGGEWSARVEQMGRSQVSVQLLAHDPVDRELAQHVTLAIGMPANERMDALVEKATELGVAALQPLVCERSVLRLSGERAEKRQAHWQAVAVAACEQSGRTRVPQVAPVLTLPAWLAGQPAREGVEACVLDPRADTGALPLSRAALFLSGPEGGLSDAEVQLAEARGFRRVGLGPRVLRADTAPLAVLAHLSLRSL